MAKRKKRRGGGQGKRAEADEEIAPDDRDDEAAEAADGGDADEEAGKGSREKGGASTGRPLAPGVPDPDGDNVSEGGGLVMMGIVFSLIVLAVVAQYFMD